MTIDDIFYVLELDFDGICGWILMKIKIHFIYRHHVKFENFDAEVDDADIYCVEPILEFQKWANDNGMKFYTTYSVATHFNQHNMPLKIRGIRDLVFHFTNKKNAMFFKLRWSDRIKKD
jgi:hypothetical protein